MPALAAKAGERRAGMRPPKVEPAPSIGAGLDLGALAGMPVFLQRVVADMPVRAESALNFLSVHPVLHRAPNHTVRTIALTRAQQNYGDRFAQRVFAGSRLSGPSQGSDVVDHDTPDSVTTHPKLEISQPNDSAEQEADHVADQVMRMPDPGAGAPAVASASSGVQRKCACGGTPGISGACEECSKVKRLGLQTKLTINEPGDIYEQEADRIAGLVIATSAPSRGDGLPPRIQPFSGQSNAQMDAVPSSVDQALANPGRPLEPALRQDMEQRFGHDLSRVRVHTDTSAAESAHAVSASAYTVGGDIVFGRGHYAPGTSAGKRLLAHELTHVLQQLGGDEISPDLSPGKRDPSFGGQQAAGIADDGGKRMPIRSATTSAITLQRDATDDLADFIAHDLDDYVAKNPLPYKHVIEVIHFSEARELDDNVAAAFTKLQSPARLETFAATAEGRAMLDVLTEAMITGSVSLFESQQAERILIAKRTSISAEHYAAQAERIAELRHKASLAFSEDEKVTQLAKDLDVYLANNLYAHVIEVFDDLPSNIEDNVAAALVELQSPAKLEEFAATDKGRAMLDVLYEAMITGKVSSFESLQSERILIAKAKEIPPEQYVAEAERIATLRDVAEDSLEELVVDMAASEAAHELNDDVAKQLYGDVIKKIHDLSSDIEDNVASHFIELQSPAKLEKFAANNDGRAMLDVLYEAIITGDVSAFEKLQAERILEAKAKQIPSVSVEQYVEQLKEERQYIFPLRMQKTFRSSYAIFKATLQPNGKVKVRYDDQIHFWAADMFKEDRKNLPPERVAKTGFELNPDELVWLKLYDQDEKLVPVPAIALIDYANQAMRHSVSVGVTAFQAGLFLGFGGLGAFSGARVSTLAAQVEAGEASVAALNLQRAVLWADRVAMALPVVSIVVNENRDWILEKFPNAGPVVLGFLDQANRIAEYYGWARMGIDGARYLKSRLDPALAQWRAERAAAGKLSSSQRKAVEGIDGELEIIQNDLSKTETEAGNKAVKYVEEHPNDPLESGKPGERSAKVGEHKVTEVKDPATGVIHCEFHSNGGPEVPCPKQWTEGEPQAEPSTETEPTKTGEPVEPTVEATAAVRAAEKAKRLEDITQESALNDAKIRELDKKIEGARERWSEASAKAVDAKGAERDTLLDKARRNKESANGWKDDRSALRRRNNALRDEAARLAPPPPKPKTWPEAEDVLRKEFGGQKKTLSTATAEGDLGSRNIDCFTPDAVSREAKFGYQKYDQFGGKRLQDEIAKDVALMDAKKVSRTEWHFYENPGSAGIGPDSKLKAALDAAGIKIVIKK